MSVWAFLATKFLVLLVVFLLLWKGADLEKQLRGET